MGMDESAGSILSYFFHAVCYGMVWRTLLNFGSLRYYASSYPDCSRQLLVLAKSRLLPRHSGMELDREQSVYQCRSILGLIFYASRNAMILCAMSADYIRCGLIALRFSYTVILKIVFQSYILNIFVNIVFSQVYSPPQVSVEHDQFYRSLSYTNSLVLKWYFFLYISLLFEGKRKIQRRRGKKQSQKNRVLIIFLFK